VFTAVHFNVDFYIADSQKVDVFNSHLYYWLIE
jgi:hypothetical protein